MPWTGMNFRHDKRTSSETTLFDCDSGLQFSLFRGNQISYQ
jgi:hypothetical protein